MIFVTEAVDDDIARILEIERETISPPWTEGALLSEIYKEDSFFAIARYAVCRDAVYSVTGIAQGDGSPDATYSGTPNRTCGFVILRQAGDEGELFQIAVDRIARRRGVADMLMGAALDYASKNKLATVHLEVRRSNEAALCLYKKHRFESVRQRKNYYNDPVEDAVVMVKKLKNY